MLLRRGLRIALMPSMLMLPLLSNCSPVNSAPPSPTTGFADSRSSQSAFRQLEEQWLASAPGDRASLEVPLTQFVQTHPTDGHSRRARLYLAWLNLRKQDFATANRWLDLARTGATGVDGDLLEIVEASLQIASGEPHRAYARLKPLDGRLLNADDRMLYFEQLMKAALAAERYGEALQQILNLATQSARRHRDRIWRNLANIIGEIPAPALEEQLRSFNLVDAPLPGVRRSERSAARGWLLKEIRQRLSRAALKNRDVRLAQRLISDSRPASGRDPNARLRRLATQARLTPVIEGRRLGFLFDLGNPTRRQHSVEVSSGISIELRAQGPASAQSTSLHTHSIQDIGDIPSAMEQLAGEGVSLFIAGLDAASADAAAQYAESQHLPLLLMHPESSPVSRRYVRVVGSSFAESRSLLQLQLEAQGLRTIVQVGKPQQTCGIWGDPSTSQRLVPLLGRDTRKPGLLLFGAASCSEVTLDELTAIRGNLRIGIGLASLALLNQDLKVHTVWTIGAGLLPWLGGSPPESMKAWFERRNQPPTWYEALGHDLAVIAQATIPTGPEEILRDKSTVRDFHSQVVESLRNSSWRGAWTSTATAFSPDGSLKRQFQTVSVPGRAAREVTTPHSAAR